MYDPNRNLDLALVAAIIILCAIAWVVSGCATTPHAQEARWSSAYDADWAKVCACWEFTPKSKPDTVQRQDCVEKWGVKYFPTPASPTGYATGIFYPGSYSIEFCDVRALIHEFSHAILYKKTGDYGTNGAGRCWL